MDDNHVWKLCLFMLTLGLICRHLEGYQRGVKDNIHEVKTVYVPNLNLSANVTGELSFLSAQNCSLFVKWPFNMKMQSLRFERLNKSEVKMWIDGDKFDVSSETHL